MGTVARILFEEKDFPGRPLDLLLGEKEVVVLAAGEQVDLTIPPGFNVSEVLEVLF